MLRTLGLPQCSVVCRPRFLATLPSTSRGENNELNRTVIDGVAHVTSLNIMTRERSVVRLKLPELQRVRKIRMCQNRHETASQQCSLVVAQLPRRVATTCVAYHGAIFEVVNEFMGSLMNKDQFVKVRREFVVPEPAVAGLRNALISCERSPKQLQHEADQLSDILAQRRFPAPPSVVREARNKIKEMIKKQQEDEDISGLIKDDDDSRINYKLRNEVDKILKKRNFNWKPLDLETKEAAAAYALSRLAPNYAEIARVLDEFDGHSFSPSTVLDYGSGIGAGFWAVNERFGSGVKDYCMVDPSPVMTQFAMDIMRGDSGNLLFRNVSFRRHLVPSLRTKYDLVIAHRTLCELPSQESRLELVTSLWKRTNRFLVLIDSGLRDAFEALIEARDFLLCSGTQLHLEETRSLLQENDLMSDRIDAVLRDRDLSDFERFSLVRDMVPPEIQLPTALDPATVFAPCPHDLGCPKLGLSACTVPVRWRVIRADGRRSHREKSGSETGKFSFIVLEKALRHPQASAARILQVKYQGFPRFSDADVQQCYSLYY
ncbi:hypothetical protein Y032_0054g2488 [Ancylostoma ceylanicum]|uniref:Methyltransferase domain-containing protein n=1 Tax=Ancylostoma ceylanicum TaxID=53326 RepID=A0A016U684_9BILA|nr:hypothetical protein Y032_0054g2488 [Ancylostoma ceylanicum]